MSGHSKWSTIKRQKEITDNKKGQVFTKLTRAIALAVKAGGPDPESNFKLRLAVDKAKEYNMPKENVDRAIKRASGAEGGAVIDEVVYEGYGPEGIAVIIEAATDNKNRTSSEIKNVFERAGGRLVGPGAVSFQFKLVGLIVVERQANIDEQILALMDLGVEDVKEEGGVVEVFTKPDQLGAVRDKMLTGGYQVKSFELTRQATVENTLTDKGKAAKALRFMDTLEDLEDVQKVYSNFDIPQEILANLDED